MFSYYCIVSLPGVLVGDIVAVAASDDAGAERELSRIALLWPGYETVTLYEGERVVTVRANPAFGLTSDPLTPEPLAA